jgi:SAM-dependent methyltransferase
MLDAIRRLRPARILEIGSGTGSLAIFLSYFAQDVVSVDLSSEVLARAERNNRRLRGRARFQLGDAFSLREFAPQSFDVAMSQGFFEHFQDDEIVALLRQQLRVANHVVFSVPNRAYGRQDRGDERLMTRDEWDAILLGGGFEIVESCDYRPVTRQRVLSFGRRETATMYLATVRQPRSAARRLSIIRRPEAESTHEAEPIEAPRAEAA